MTAGPAGRDRDRAGRPRNARARDGLGRPLPRGVDAGVARVPDELNIGVDEAIALADEMLRTGAPFHAHEVLEAVWKSGPAAERDLWQGLAQIAVGLTHARRGNASGAVALLRRGSRRVAGYPGPAHGIAVARVIARSSALADRIQNDGLESIPETGYLIGLLTDAGSG